MAYTFWPKDRIARATLYQIYDKIYQYHLQNDSLL